jgi:hypothetical protein
MMRFYDHQHRFYAGIDLHARTMHVCVLDAAGTVVLDRNLPCHFETLLQAIAPFRKGIVIGVECMFGWYWLADRCAEHQIPFVVGHALYMKPIHGGKAKNDRIDTPEQGRGQRRTLVGLAHGGGPPPEDSFRSAPIITDRRRLDNRWRNPCPCRATLGAPSAAN